ncbi:glutamine synthetase family protein [Franconibacter helveticus]|uniref:glutamine synthetase family protein n=1 Tax=Franconibacter helveticus TaxID=357240 RepID=UPI000DA155E8|nr:glutamine synthetase family protein [Franconibacter helveticus]
MFSMLFHADLLAQRYAPAAMTFAQEARAYLREHPQTEAIDIYLYDCHGRPRGKKIGVDALLSLEEGCYFPLSLYATELEGQIAHVANDTLSTTEPDRLCLPVPGTLKPCAKDPARYAQLQMTMREPDGAPCPLEPRVILQKMLATFHRRGLYPVIAPEMEFYLSETPEEAAASGCPFLNIDGAPAAAALLAEIEHDAGLQERGLTGIVAEAGSGQYELNFRHTDNLLAACDNLLAMKRLIRQLAQARHHSATFMAKPHSDKAGSGMHFHISLNNAQGANLFAGAPDALPEIMQHAMAGLLALMPASLALLAPNVNAWRRLRPLLAAPRFSGWGHNNRATTIRIPCASAKAQRFEYRLAGSDANPYLAVAALLAAMLYGMDKMPGLPPADASPPPLPANQHHALTLFALSPWLREQLGEEFTRLWLISKQEELARFEHQVTEAEKAWQL